MATEEQVKALIGNSITVKEKRFLDFNLKYVSGIKEFDEIIANNKSKNNVHIDEHEKGFVLKLFYGFMETKIEWVSLPFAEISEIKYFKKSPKDEILFLCNGEKIKIYNPSVNRIRVEKFFTKTHYSTSINFYIQKHANVDSSLNAIEYVMESNFTTIADINNPDNTEFCETKAPIDSTPIFIAILLIIALILLSIFLTGNRSNQIVIMFSFIVRFFTAFWVDFLAKNRNQNRTRWVIFCLISPILALIFIGFIRPQNKTIESKTHHS